MTERIIPDGVGEDDLERQLRRLDEYSLRVRCLSRHVRRQAKKLNGELRRASHEVRAIKDILETRW